MNEPYVTLEPLLRVNEVCELLGISRSTMYKLIREGEFVPTFVGSRCRFEAEEIREYLRRNRQEVA